MRQIGTIPQQQSAVVFADYLLTLGIKSQVDPEGADWGVWIYDEDRMPQARDELQAYQQNPADPKYATAIREAAALRLEADRNKPRQNVVQLRDRWVTPRGMQPLITVLLALSILASIATSFGKANPKLLARLMISSTNNNLAILMGTPAAQIPQLPEVRKGEVWRLITPIFLHFDVMHLVFNLLMLQSLGNAIEFRKGTLAALGIIAIIAVLSNLVQYESSLLTSKTHPGSFGGMSGVVYGLFGYTWAKGRFDLSAGLGVPPSTALIMMVWLVACLANFIPNVANGAHVGGLITGAVLALIPVAWRKLTAS